MARKRKRRIWLYILLAILVLIIAFVVYYRLATLMDPPTDLDPLAMGYEREEHGKDYYQSGNSWLRIHGNIEMYLEGDPLELGIMHGLLAQELIEAQESYFVDQIRVMIPSESYLNFLKYFTAWFNKDLDKYIKEEYLLEIYGVSAFASEGFNFIGPNYDRILNYHAAHDIGHALQNMDLVKCTAFGVWDEKSADSSIIIGRNFDFYVGDNFAKNKIIAFVNPEQGYKFASITWGSMIGVVSGMNEHGLTVTLNSAKSDIPYGARTPVSIIAREILQYASNIEEAMHIASSRESFVSESFLIGSAADHNTVVIEKSVDTTILYDPDTNYIIQTNHFQSGYFKNSPLTQENMANETSVYRHERVQELIKEIGTFNHDSAAVLLRDRRGKIGQNIGQGNEKAINQLIAHHSIIFKPEDRKFWISTRNWGLSEYSCYDLDSVFSLVGNPGNSNIDEKLLEIMPDSAWFQDGSSSLFDNYRLLLGQFQEAIKDERVLQDDLNKTELFISYNPELYIVYTTLGQYFEMLGNHEEAIKYYNLALTKEVASRSEKEAIQERIERCEDE